MKLMLEFMSDLSIAFIVSVSLISFISFIKNRCEAFLISSSACE